MKRHALFAALMCCFSTEVLAGYVHHGKAGNRPVFIEAGLYELYGTSPNGAPYRGTASITRISREQYAVKWCMGKMYFGQGRVKGAQLVVNWGGNYPVVYAVAGSRLDGVWANGNATDILTLRKPSPDADCERDRI